jgi:hypothetical protein
LHERSLAVRVVQETKQAPNASRGPGSPICRHPNTPIQIKEIPWSSRLPGQDVNDWTMIQLEDALIRKKKGSGVRGLNLRPK